MSANREERRAAQAQLARENAKQTVALSPVPAELWPPRGIGDVNVIAVWRSRAFLVQVVEEGNGIIRLSVNRTSMNTWTGRWDDAITWDELQRLKRECGYGDQDAVEVYPADRDVVNVANIRHLWVMPSALPFKWSRP